MDIADVVGLVHLEDALHDLLCQFRVRGMHAVLGDENGGHYLNILGQGVAEGDGSIGHRLAILHHYVEVATVHLINMMLPKKSLLHAVEPQLGTPIVDGILLSHLYWLLVACRQQ